VDDGSDVLTGSVSFRREGSEEEAEHGTAPQTSQDKKSVSDCN
jgi:hypothetical protein